GSPGEAEVTEESGETGFEGDGEGGEGEGGYGTKSRLKGGAPADPYGQVLDEALVRLDDLDRSHRASLSLLLGEMDRLPRAEAVWLKSVDRISSWKLDDDLEPRYRKAIAAFDGPEWWKKLARWYARREKAAELKGLGEEIVAGFRGSALFSRDPMLDDAVVALEGQPNPYVLFSDFLALRALQRFPSSPAVLERAEARLLSRSDFDARKAKRPADVKARAVVDDALMTLRRDAVLWADAPRRVRFLDDLMRKAALEAFLRRLEESPAKTPVENVLLLDGWARLSRFERAVPFAEALSEAYPGDPVRAVEAIALERSLSAFSPERAAAAERIAGRAAAAAADPSPFWTPIGEMWQDLERPAPAGVAFRKVLAASPRSPGTILETATAFWDYGRFGEALEVLSEGRTRLGQPALHAFEAGVLKEELRDRDGAISEYVSALAEEGEGSWRSRQRLGRLVGRPAIRDSWSPASPVSPPASPPTKSRSLRTFRSPSSTRPGRTTGTTGWTCRTTRSPAPPAPPAARRRAPRKARERSPSGRRSGRRLSRWPPGRRMPASSLRSAPGQARSPTSAGPEPTARRFSRASFSRGRPSSFRRKRRASRRKPPVRPGSWTAGAPTTRRRPGPVSFRGSTPSRTARRRFAPSPRTPASSRRRAGTPAGRSPTPPAASPGPSASSRTRSPTSSGPGATPRDSTPSRRRPRARPKGTASL
ncbi:MAG: hypothetical protein IPP07_05125, partial [Holophagales bacterium]|nr:hypothetical protein [Holophagales bacterium]